MERPFLLALASVGAACLSFATLAIRGDGPVAHATENATWGLVAAAVVLALLASDGARADRRVKALLGIAFVLAAGRAGLLLGGLVRG